MAILQVPDRHTSHTDETEIRHFLNARGIMYDRWPSPEAMTPATPDHEVLAAYRDRLTPFMEQGGYRTVDVVTVTGQTPNLDAIRDKFLREHTHSEDEVRMFVEGEGLFWFHLERDTDEVFSLLCQAGDVIAVPADTKHWFDLGKHPAVRAIRIFTDQASWVPHYTNSRIEERYQAGA
jgi:1,2-dihydroxy-3-keto-5-methylthiopentene dioxygenase